MNSAESTLGEARQLYDELKDEIRALPAEDRMIWIAEAKKHQETLKRVMKETSAMRQFVDARPKVAPTENAVTKQVASTVRKDAVVEMTPDASTETTPEVSMEMTPEVSREPVSDGGELMTVSDKSMTSEGISSRQHVLNDVHIQLAKLEESLDQVDHQMKSGKIDGGLAERMEHAQQLYDDTKVTACVATGLPY